jgi:dTMP kinase
MKYGLLIAFVGVDGSGKTTHSKLLRKVLENYNMKASIVKAYSDRDSMVLKKYKADWDEFSMTLFFQILHRFQNNKVKKILERKEIAIADKWNEAYFAYHNNFGILSKNKNFREKLDQFTFSQGRPDICFYMRIEPEEIKRRLNKRKNLNISDSLALNKTKILFDFFEKQAKINKWIVIDGLDSIENNFNFIKNYVFDHLPLKHK